MQDYPICFKCKTHVEHSPVYEAPCGHDRCSSVVFHGLCLMEYREIRARGGVFEVVAMHVKPWTGEHS